MAPTRPLVSQQVEACYNVMGIPYEDISEMTGNVHPKKRAEEWASKRCFFVTPHILNNDFDRSFIDPSSICCLVIDEAHKATGAFAYVHVVKSIATRTKKCRIVALTATPASTASSVQVVIDNLLISGLQVKSEADPDISRYIQSKTVEKIVVKLPPPIQRIRQVIGDAMAKHLGLLVAHDAYYSADPDRAPEYTLIQAQAAFMAKINDNAASGSFRHSGMIFGAFAQAKTLAQGRKLLSIHGLRPFLDFCEQKRGEAKPGKSTKTLLDSPSFGQMYGLAKKAVENGVVHPKVQEVQRLLTEHFKQDPESRVIIFITYRNSVDAVVEHVKNLPGVACSRFVGQSGDRKDGTRKGQKQSEQQDVISKFRDGIYNTLVATCVGEEGLDVGECDLIILYDTSNSPIRTVQRMGRTGRKRQGRCVALVTEGSEEAAYDRAKSRGAGILRTLINKQNTFRFYVPKTEEVQGLVPGYIGNPVIQPPSAPKESIQDARRRMKIASTASSSRSKGSFVMFFFCAGLNFFFFFDRKKSLQQTGFKPGGKRLFDCKRIRWCKCECS